MLLNILNYSKAKCNKRPETFFVSGNRSFHGVMEHMDYVVPCVFVGITCFGKT